MKILLITFLLAIPVAAQEATSGITQKRLAKVLDVLDKTETVVASQFKEIEAYKMTVDSQKQLIEAQNKLIELQKLVLSARQEEVDALRKVKCSTTSFFWGIIKRKACS